MIESLFLWESARLRQRQAPLLNEREQYLGHMLNVGMKAKRVRDTASVLLHVVRLMNLDSLRAIEIAEIVEASQRWTTDTVSHTTRAAGESSAEAFKWIAIRWFEFHNVMTVPVAPERPHDAHVAEFRRFTEVSGLSPTTIGHYYSITLHFLRWMEEQPMELGELSLNDVDRYLYTDSALSRRTVRARCVALRRFLSFAETRGWTTQGISAGIEMPNASRTNRTPSGPCWRDVRRLLAANSGTTPSELRLKAMLLLGAIYGLRSCEILNLTLGDFNWIDETFTVRRAKRGPVQRFPLQFEVGEGIIKYLRYGRAACSSRHLFVSIGSPHRKISGQHFGFLVRTELTKTWNQVGFHGTSLTAARLRDKAA